MTLRTFANLYLCECDDCGSQHVYDASRGSTFQCRDCAGDLEPLREATNEEIEAFERVQDERRALGLPE